MSENLTDPLPPYIGAPLIGAIRTGSGLFVWSFRNSVGISRTRLKPSRFSTNRFRDARNTAARGVFDTTGTRVHNTNTPCHRGHDGRRVFLFFVFHCRQREREGGNRFAVQRRALESMRFRTPYRVHCHYCIIAVRRAWKRSF